MIGKLPSQWCEVVSKEEDCHGGSIWAMMAEDNSREGRGVANQSITGISMQMRPRQSKLTTG